MIHLAHYSDGVPLCWTLEQVASEPAPDPEQLTNNESRVSCSECLSYMKD